ncbi:MAG TPA: Fic family protein [Acidimicrobiia bacterium]
MHVDEILFLELDDAVRAHARGLEDFGGRPGTLDLRLVESAMMAPQAGRYPSLAAIAVAYCYGIAKNHGFEDGNKRAGLIVAGTFLRVHGFPLQLGKGWADDVERAVDGKITRDDLIGLFTAAMGGDPITIDYDDVGPRIEL